MPRPARLDELSPEARAELDRQIVARNFKDYAGIVEWIREQGWFLTDEEPGISVIHRHGAKLKRRLEAVKASTQAARMIAEAAPDDADLRSAAVISMVQSELFELLLNLQEADAEDDPATRVELMAKAARGVADLSRASVSQKKWKTEVEARIRAEERAGAEQAAAAAATKAGVSAEGIAAIRAAIAARM